MFYRVKMKSFIKITNAVLFKKLFTLDMNTTLIWQTWAPLYEKIKSIKKLSYFFSNIIAWSKKGNTGFFESLKMCRIFTKVHIFFLTLVFQVEYEKNRNSRTPSLTSTGTSTGKNCSLFDFLCTAFHVYYKYSTFKKDKCFV